MKTGGFSRWDTIYPKTRTHTHSTNTGKQIHKHKHTVVYLTSNNLEVDDSSFHHFVWWPRSALCANPPRTGLAIALAWEAETGEGERLVCDPVTYCNCRGRAACVPRVHPREITIFTGRPLPVCMLSPRFRSPRWLLLWGWGTSLSYWSSPSDHSLSFRSFSASWLACLGVCQSVPLFVSRLLQISTFKKFVCMNFCLSVSLSEWMSSCLI